MRKTNTCNNQNLNVTSATFEWVTWPNNFAQSLSDTVIAVQTTRAGFDATVLGAQKQVLVEKSTAEKKAVEKKSYQHFNLGLHVGDNAELVNHNRHLVTQFINQQRPADKQAIKIQWLEQVHSSEVVEVTVVNDHAITADASITRDKNVALAIMTADCLPILLTDKEGKEVAAIHGGWRPLAGNIIAKTVNQMHSKPTELIAWLGPCIGNSAFEVGGEVKQAFVGLDPMFNRAFVKQANGKYLADLQLIARLQLSSLGVTAIAALKECTYQQTNKYYSYRKEQVTGRMATIICRR